MAEGEAIPVQTLNEGRFNFGIDNLYEISGILKKIRDMSVNPHFKENEYVLPLGKAQHIKAKLLRQLFNRIAPLINQKEYIKKEDEGKTLVDKFRQRILNIKVVWLSSNMGSPIVGQVDRAVPKGYYEAYNPQYDLEMDDIVLDLVLAMQEQGKYFMPSKREASLF